VEKQAMEMPRVYKVLCWQNVGIQTINRESSEANTILNKRTVFVLLLAASSSVCAEYPVASGTDHEFERRPWRTVDANMSPNEYRDTCRENQRLAQDTLMFYSKRTFTSIGVPEAGIEFMGAAVGLAMHDARFHLNKSGTVALELKDVADKDRTVFLGIKMAW
jgi:hypothetical protein